MFAYNVYLFTYIFIYLVKVKPVIVNCLFLLGLFEFDTRSDLIAFQPMMIYVMYQSNIARIPINMITIINLISLFL